MIIVGMGVKNSFDFIDADAQRCEAVQQVGAGIDQINFAFERQDAGHAWSMHIPAVAFAAVDDAEVLSGDLMKP